MLKQWWAGVFGWGMVASSALGAFWNFPPQPLPHSVSWGPTQFVKYAFNRDNNPVIDPTAPLSVDWTFTAHEPLQQASYAGGVIYVSGDGGDRRNALDNRIYALDAQTGQLLWSHRLNNMSMTTPVVADGLVFVGTGTQQFQGMNLSRENQLRSRHIIRGTGPSAIWALSARTGAVVWRFPTRGEDMPSFVYHRGLLYCANGQGEVYAFDARTGRLAWSRSIGSYVSMSSPVLGPGGTLYVSGAHPYAIYAIDTRTHQIRWRRILPQVFAGSDDSGLSWADHRLVVEGTVGSWTRPKSALFCLDAKSGRLLYRRILGSGVLPRDIEVSTPVVVGHRVYLGSPLTGQEYAYGLQRGQQLWHFSAAGPIASSAAVTAHTVYVGDERGFLYALDARTGRERGSLFLSGVMAADYPIVVGHTLYQPDENGQLFALDRRAVFFTQQHRRPKLPRPGGALGQTILAGEEEFRSSWPGSAGKSCETCHIAGGTATAFEEGEVVPSLLGAASGYPKIVDGQVRTLDDEINRCLAALKQPALSSQDPRLRALDVYLRWLSSGWPVEIDRQVGPIRGAGGGCQ
ncbi:MAG: PQQ-binding-like beta-propeller repeat protein [Firmicutes bacterium]|nr:PQQ-binding-like beta-propeller repeat protein [Bacillota bacterium]